MSGCYALSTTLTRRLEDEEEESSISYLAIVDTGSPFLTAPSRAMGVTERTDYDASNEQYGETLGGMEWKSANLATWITTDGLVVDVANVTLGIASPQVIQETGGIFVGLIAQDDNRPTWLQQIIGNKFSFQIDFVHHTLLLTHRRLLTAAPTKKSTTTQSDGLLPLYDLSPYGSDLYHYAVECQTLELQWRTRENDDPPTTTLVPSSSLRRPLVVVLDTGLTGCIVSKTLQDELKEDLPVGAITTEALAGLRVGVSTTTTTAEHDDKLLHLSTSSQYWQVACFKLPWFDEKTHGETYPHVIALGATVWASGQVASLSVDTMSRLARIVKVTEHS